MNNPTSLKLRRTGKLRVTNEKKSTTNTGYLVLAAGLVLIAALARLLPHPPNFAPIGAIALFGGARLGRWWGLTITLGAMLLSDTFIGFHSGMWYVYAAFTLTHFIGRSFASAVTAPNIIGGSLLASTVFFLITNFGVWAEGLWLPTHMYPLTADGLVTSYVMGIPFFGATLVSDLLYSGTLFGAHALVQLKFKLVSSNQLPVGR